MQKFIGRLCSRYWHCQILCGATTCKNLLDVPVADIGTLSYCVVQLHAKLYWTALEPVLALSDIVWGSYMQNVLGLICNWCGDSQVLYGASTYKMFLDCSVAHVGTVRLLVVQFQANIYWTAL